MLIAVCGRVGISHTPTVIYQGAGSGSFHYLEEIEDVIVRARLDFTSSLRKPHRLCPDLDRYGLA